MQDELSKKARLRLERFSAILRSFGQVDRYDIGSQIASATSLSLSEFRRLLSPFKDTLPQGVTVDFLAESVHKKIAEPSPDTLAWRRRFAAVSPQLDKIPVGHKYANRYHHHVFELLKAVFDDFLTNGKIEQEINTGIQRIDIMFDNSEGVFRQIGDSLGRPCPHIPFECKNYASDLGNPEYDQLLGRLNPDVGAIGVLVFRSITDWERANTHCQARWKDEKVILLFDNEDLAMMYEHRYNGNLDLLDKVVLDRFRSIKLNVKAK